MELNCWNCLVAGNRLNEAVTLHGGTAYCENCAHEMAEQYEANDAEMAQHMDDLVAEIAERQARLSPPIIPR